MAEESEAIEEETTSDPAEGEDRARSGPGFIRGLVLGMIVGAAGATLFAPATGEQIRQRVAEEAAPVLKRSEGEGGPEGPPEDTPMARMRGALDRVRSRVQEASEEAQEAAREAEEQSRARYEELTRQEEPPA